MNCKPGDLALVVRSKHAPENVGKIVQCIRILTKKDLYPYAQYSPEPIWLVDKNMKLENGLTGGLFERPWAPDFALKPISPDDAAKKYFTQESKYEETLRQCEAYNQQVKA